MKKVLGCCLLLACLLMLAAFNKENAIVPKDKVLSGRLPKDGIPAILNPQLNRPQEAELLKPDDGVIGYRQAVRPGLTPSRSSTGMRWSTIPSMGSPLW